MKPDCILVTALTDPGIMRSLNLKQWDLLIRQARNANLSGRLNTLCHENGLLEHIPEQAINHLSSAQILADRQVDTIRWEVNRIQQALERLDVPVVLLKGAAYLLSGLPAAKGRIFTDIDLLFRKKEIDAVEKTLLLFGWFPTKMDEYDQRYYRTWMHEIPPLSHIKRLSVLDVHHAILPETASLHPDTEKLLENIIPVKGFDNLFTLSEVDMVLHSATHLFHDGELENGLRDLIDLDALLRHFSENNPDFWNDIVLRAHDLELSRPLYYAFKYSNKLLNTPIPKNILTSLDQSPIKPLAWFMDRLFSRALQPDHASCDDGFTGIARWLLYVRSHYLRMPFQLLLPHLLRKAWMRRFNEQDTTI
ncbi:MAG: nucleotidyltransferase family protein [Gammaproteobacteria bacterium]|nr:nucleotidyltransferase family protein [Gammaproteobacteria bacterium]